MRKNINSKEYWDSRFGTGSWKENEGDKQSEFFYQIAIDLMPKWLKDEIDKNKYSICDLGCAEGDGTYLLYKEFFNSNINGVDFSEKAIKICNEKYSDINFYVANLQKLEQEYDILFSSNTLEHFRKPFELLEKLMDKSNKYTILLLPLNEVSRIEEHLSSFKIDTIPLSINHNKLVYYDLIDCNKKSNTKWAGEQILLVYYNEANKKISHYNLDKLINNNYNQNLNELLKTQKDKNDRLEKDKNDRLEKDKNDRLEKDKNDRLEKDKNDRLEKEKKKLQDETIDITSQLEEVKNMLYKSNIEKEEVNSKLWSIYSSTLWKTGLKYYYIRDNTLFGYPFRVLKKIRLKKSLKSNQNGVNETSQDKNLVKVDKSLADKKSIDLLLSNKSYPIIFAPLVDWNIPLFQRPQHIALNLASLGNIYFYCTNNVYDNIEGVDSIEGLENLYITDQYEYIMSLLKPKVFHMYAQDFNITKEMLKKILDDGNIVVYEYIDALSEDLCTGKEDVIERHLYAMQDERCIIICTASSLYEEVSQYRNKNYELVTNGVEIHHFSKKLTTDDIPEDIRHVVEKNKPIIGYFGALAKWFDYELIEKLAKNHEDYEIVLIGWDYDGSLEKSSISEFENITVVGPIDYQKLPKYAYWFTVSTIPFIINDITVATSPIKLFEYMALGHPIVTTDMPECRKYKSVDIGKSHNEFIKKIEAAINKSDCKKTKELLKSEALKNTWLEKSKCIDNLVKNNISKLQIKSENK